eukprot:GHVP01013292.1.p1 GENE.GHVP01013292.1~~GHVP01013292.1.p1  ORF type:complete len:304 (+),score=36.22 GHVP01013292.1:27-938(+)
MLTFFFFLWGIYGILYPKQEQNGKFSISFRSVVTTFDTLITNEPMADEFFENLQNGRVVCDLKSEHLPLPSNWDALTFRARGPYKRLGEIFFLGSNLGKRTFYMVTRLEACKEIFSPSRCGTFIGELCELDLARLLAPKLDSRGEEISAKDYFEEGFSIYKKRYLQANPMKHDTSKQQESNFHGNRRWLQNNTTTSHDLHYRPTKAVAWITGLCQVGLAQCPMSWNYKRSCGSIKTPCPAVGVNMPQEYDRNCGNIFRLDSTELEDRYVYVTIVHWEDGEDGNIEIRVDHRGWVSTIICIIFM